MKTAPSTPAKLKVDHDTSIEARLRAESEGRFLRGESDDNFDDCEGTRSVPSTAKNVAERRAIFKKHGFK